MPPSDANEVPVLHVPEGGWTRCRKCRAQIVFAVMYTTGKSSPFQLDDVGEWEIANGVARHVGKLGVQPDLFAGAASKVQRWTSHFAACPFADEFRRK